MESIFGEIIYSYSRADALEDGTLVNLPADICRQYFKFPVAVTASIWSLIEAAVRSKKHHNSYDGVICDILWMSRNGITKHIDDTQHFFEVIITGTGRKRIHAFKIQCHPGDNAEPVLTIMMPWED